MTDLDAAALDDGACVWPVDYSACLDCEPALTDENRPTFEGMATELLGRWTGGVFGLCPVVVRPCRAECIAYRSTWWGRGPFPWGSAGGWMPYLLNGKWYNAYCGTCGEGAGCSCSRGDRISLPGPVNEPVTVVIDGVTLDHAAYRIQGGKWLVRVDGGYWPSCQNLDALDGTEGTWSVEYTIGTPVPVGGQVAAGILACELAKAACGDPTCGLPQRIQSVTRQGVTVTVLDSFDDVEKGRTGIWLIDSWVAAITQPARRGIVRSPDYPPRRR